MEDKQPPSERYRIRLQPRRIQSPKRDQRGRMDLVRQVLGAIAQFEKASAVAKLAAARKRKRDREGRCEGRKPLSVTRPEVVYLARKLRRRKPKGGRLSLRQVSIKLTAQGYLNERGKPYAPKSVASVLS